VTSPTFTLSTEYATPRFTFVHMDLYRLGGPDDLLAIGFPEYLETGAVVAVEWPERAGDLIPADALHVKLVLTGDPDTRLIEVSGAATAGVLEQDIQRALVQRVGEVGQVVGQVRRLARECVRKVLALHQLGEVAESRHVGHGGCPGGILLGARRSSRAPASPRVSTRPAANAAQVPREQRAARSGRAHRPLRAARGLR
jgi:hypothetical protein